MVPNSSLLVIPPHSSQAWYLIPKQLFDSILILNIFSPHILTSAHHAHHFTNGANGVNGATTKKATAQTNTLLASFLDGHRELEAYKYVFVPLSVGH